MRFTINNLSRKIHYGLFICIVSTLPFSIKHVQLNSFFIILFAINATLLIILSNKNINLTKKGLFILMISLYLIHVFGLLKTDNLQSGFFELQKKLSLLIFPVFLFFTPKFSVIEFKRILLSFVISCLLTGLFCLIGAACYYITEKETKFFFYHDLAGIVGMHAIYLSIYFCFSIAILLYGLSAIETTLIFKNKIIYYFSLIFLAILVLLLAGRMQIVFLIIGTMLYFTFSFRKNESKLKSIIRSGGISLFLLGIVFAFPVNRDRFKEAINFHSEYSIDKKWGGRALRELNWASAIALIKKNPYSGVGTGDVQDELEKYYIAHNYTPLLFWKSVKYNAHNQFLETTIAFGIPGLLLLLSVLIACLANAIKYRNALYAIFLILFMFSCLTESILERQHGVVFFSLFNALFAFQYPGLKQK